MHYKKIDKLIIYNRNNDKKTKAMKTYKIIRIDIVTKEVEPIESIKTDNKDKLKDRLLELQEGYCEGNEKPEINEKVFTSNGIKINTLIASSEVDFCYAAPLEIIKEL